MDVTGQYRIAMPREAVWNALMDADTLSRSIPGCQKLEQTASNKFHARIALAIGPVRATFDTDLELENLDPPESYRLIGSGRAGAVGFGQGEASVELGEDGDTGTVLSYSAGFQVGGRLAQVGSRLVLGATRKLVDAFFANLVREMDAEAERADAAATAPAPRRARLVTMLIAALVIVLLLWWLLGPAAARALGTGG